MKTLIKLLLVLCVLGGKVMADENMFCLNGYLYLQNDYVTFMMHDDENRPLYCRDDNIGV